MDGLKVGPSRTQLFRAHANTMEEAIQIALQEEYSHRQARTPTSVWQDHNASTGVVQGAPATGTSTGPVPMELGTAVQSSIRCYGCGKLGHMQRACPAGGQRKFPSKPRGSRGPWQKPRPKSEGNWGRQSADGARHGGLAPGSLGALETRKSSGGLLVVHASVSVRLADGTVVNVPGVRMDLAVKFEDFDSMESFLVLDMDKNALILGMPWLEKHEPWIGWRGKAIGASRPAVSDRALVNPQVGNIGPPAGNVVPQAGNIGPQAAEAAEESAKGVSCVGNIDPQVGNIGPPAGNVVPQAGNIGPQAAEAAGEAAESASGVGNIVPHKVEETEKKIESAGTAGRRTMPCLQRRVRSSSEGRCRPAGGTTRGVSTAEPRGI
ncbi:Gag protein, partial [Phytophthora palmivora]